MSLKVFLIITFISVASASLDCKSFNDRNHGFGCQIRNVQATDTADFEINVISKDKTDSDITWMQIRDSQFENLPPGIFEKFDNMKKIMILTTTGFRHLNTTYFDKKITLILMKNTDLEDIGGYAFVGLRDVTVLSLNYNKITRVHKNSFSDLLKVEKIEMVNNNIETLEDDILKNNVNLRLLVLYNNKIRVLTTQLLYNNVNLESLQIQNNSISQIEQGFHSKLTKLTRADFKLNFCINDVVTLTRSSQWSSQLVKFRSCFNNYAVMKAIMKEMDDTIENYS